jgi:membrane protease YdiL (CAAX protease family)
MKRSPEIAGLLIVLTQPFLCLGWWTLPETRGFLEGFAGLSRVLSRETVGALAAVLSLALLAFIVRRWEKETWASIGLRHLGSSDFVAALGAGFIGFWVSLQLAAWNPVARWMTDSLNGAGSRYLARPAGALLMTFAAKVTWEETAFRGYFIERLTKLTSKLWLAAAASILVSTAWHVPGWGLEGALYRADGMLIYTMLYLWRRNLAACVLAHYLHNSVVIMLFALPIDVRNAILGFLLFRPW